MAYLSSLANDIFISYAHADNTEAWIDKFHERLLHKLKQLDRKVSFTVWRDLKLSDKMVRLWDVATRRPLGDPLLGHMGPVTSVAFSPDGKMIVSASNDKAVWLWDVDPVSWMSRTCAIVNRNLTLTEWQQDIGIDVRYHKTCSSLPPGAAELE